MEYDELVETEGSPYAEPEPAAAWAWTDFNPLSYLAAGLTLLEEHGWTILFSAIALVYIVRWLSKNVTFFQKDEDAEYKKDPDKALARMEAIQRARELQQQKLEEASRRAQELQREREERKRAEALERLEKYGTAAGRKLGTQDDGYLPLSGGASTSTYRPPKKSKCGGGGCGR